jgi:hypothetical protein
MKIGITVKFPTDSIWSNGINQNAMYLGMALQKAGHDVYLIISEETIEIDGTTTAVDVLKQIPLGLKTIGIKPSFHESWDVVIRLSLSVEEVMKRLWLKQNPNFKLVNYECACKLVIDTERMIFNAHGAGDHGRPVSFADPDQIWLIPQHESMNIPYFQFIGNCENATPVPFVWDSIALETEAKKRKYKTEYTPRDFKNMAIMEPNTNMVKTCVTPVMIVDKFHKQVKDHLDHLYVAGSMKLKDNKAFISFITKTQLFKDKLISIDPRIFTHRMLEQYADLIVSWQWENALNYFYIDVAYLGYPIVHNADLCKDIGYYYKGTDVDTGVKQIKKVIKTHNEDKDYLNRNREIIKRYTNENKKLLENYNSLLDDLVNNKFRKRKYNWKTNTIS